MCGLDMTATITEEPISQQTGDTCLLRCLMMGHFSVNSESHPRASLPRSRKHTFPAVGPPFPQEGPLRARTTANSFFSFHTYQYMAHTRYPNNIRIMSPQHTLHVTLCFSLHFDTHLFYLDNYLVKQRGRPISQMKQRLTYLWFWRKSAYRAFSKGPGSCGFIFRLW